MPAMRPGATNREPSTRTWAALLARFAAGIAGAALLALVLVQAWQVFARYVLNDSPGWTEPVTVLLLGTTMSLGAAACVHAGRHFGFVLLVDALPARWRRMLEVSSSLTIAGIGAVLAAWSAVLLADGWGIRAAGAPMPEGIAYLPLAIGGVLVVVFALHKAALALAAARLAHPARGGD
jgi:TRAP-type C4-dicarboxylate transport system permease small subunit